MRPFDPVGVDLEGPHMVEASAGTGKTYNISFLFVRLVAALGLEVDRILVVTFTEAATSELRERLRGALKDTLAALEGAPSQDEVLARLVEDLEKIRGAAIERLRRAVLDFDLAAISTIHGFCLKTLEENAFESKARFDVQLMADQSQLYGEIAADIWSSGVFDGAPPFLANLENRRVGVDHLGGLIRLAASRPDLRILMKDPAGSVGDYMRVFGEARRIWLASRGEIEELLRSSGSLNRNSWRKTSIGPWLERLDEVFEEEIPTSVPRPARPKKPPPGDVLWRFSRSNIERTTKANLDPESHPFFDACEELLEGASLLDDLVDAFRARAMEEGRVRLARRKEDLGVQSFDDLLIGVRRALADGPGGARLANVVRKKYGAVLIDEFQDTDPVQYDIFAELFLGTKAPLFLIGDPKQSIYAFRGGDVFAYLEAASRIPGGPRTLSTNWRSDPSLVDAVNRIFGGAASPFLHEGIGFQRARPREGASDRLLAGRKRDRSGVELVFFERPEGVKHIARGRALRDLAEAVADDIGKLLRSGAVIEGRDGSELSPADVAVLVPANYQAALVQAALRARGVNSVLWSDRSVFDTDEASELATILQAVADPHDTGRIRAAMATDLMGMDAVDLDELERDDAAWGRWPDRFGELRRAWVQRGFAVMFRSLLATRIAGGDLSTATLGAPGGERRLTNLEHLGQLLHLEERQGGLGPPGLMRWFERARATGGYGQEDAQLRLESDGDAVRLVTVHKAKGLQYPIVYLPFMWSARIRVAEGGDPLFHDPDTGRIAIDLNTRDREENRRLAEAEEAGENLRLLYVALTRAQHHCKVYWGAFRDAGKSPLAYLLHNAGAGGPREAEDRFAKASDETLLRDLDGLAGESGGSVSVSLASAGGSSVSVPARVEGRALAARSLARRPPPIERVSSFSRIVSPASGGEGGRREDHGLSGYGADDLGERRIVPLDDLEASARTGSCLHEILERADLGRADDPALERLVESVLERYGLDPGRWTRPVADCVGQVARTALFEGEGSFRLGEVAPERRVAEMEFLLRVEGGAGSVGRAMEEGRGTPLPEGYAGKVDRLGAAGMRGFLKGFIDLVFEHEGRWYIVDYKSNRIGGTIGSYTPPRLVREMEAHHYFLQYHLYSLALHRHLEGTLDGYSHDENFGGVFYLFLRGVDATRGPASGVFRDRPSLEALSALGDAIGVSGARGEG